MYPKIHIDKDWLTEFSKYYSEGELATMLQVSIAIVANRKREYGLVRPKHVIDKEWLEENIKVHTIRELAIITGIPRDTIHRRMKMLGVKSPRPSIFAQGNYRGNQQLL